MAITYNQELISSLDDTTIEIYKKLMVASTGADSAYLRAKETLQQLVADGDIDDVVKAQAISSTIADITKSITAQAMTTAMAIAKEDREAPYILTKLREDTKQVTAVTAKLETDVLETQADIDLKRIQGWKIQGEVKRDYGIDAHDLAASTVIVPFTEYHDEGTKYETIRQAQANTYGAYAGAFRAHGYVSINLNADGTLANTTTGSTVQGSEGLTYWQTRVAERQEQGFDDNMRQHVANSSSTLMSMLLSTEASGIDYTPYLTKWTTAIDYLNTSDNGVI